MFGFSETTFGCVSSLLSLSQQPPSRGTAVGMPLDEGQTDGNRIKHVLVISDDPSLVRFSVNYQFREIRNQDFRNPLFAGVAVTADRFSDNPRIIHVKPNAVSLGQSLHFPDGHNQPKVVMNLRKHVFLQNQVIGIKGTEPAAGDVVNVLQNIRLTNLLDTVVNQFASLEYGKPHMFGTGIDGHDVNLTSRHICRADKRIGLILIF